jgi:putative ABC transport system permease protein
MFKNYVTLAVRNIVKDKLFAFINLAGLAISLAAFILIALYIDDETSFEDGFADNERIYRVEATFLSAGRAPRRFASIMGPGREALELEFGDLLEASTRYYNFTQSVQFGDRVFTEPFAFVDPDFLKVFDLEFVAGDPASALRDLKSVIINESMAHKYFGDGPALDQILTVNGNLDYRIGAVVKDLPHNTHLHGTGSFIALFDYQRWSAIPLLTDRWRAIVTYLYVKLAPQVDPASIEARFPELLDRHVTMQPDHPNAGMKGSEHILFHLRPITDVRLYSDVLREMSPPNATARTNTIGIVLAYAAIAILILIVASVNFINLSTAKSTARAREIGVRKVLGAVRRQLMTQFLAESVILALIALMFAMVMVELGLPWFNDLSGKAISIGYFESPIPTILFVSLLLVVGLLSGLYPAMVLSSFRPTQALSGRSRDRGSKRLRSGLTVVQFAISIGLIVATSIIYLQTRFANDIELGYDPENVLVVRLFSLEQQAQAEFLWRRIGRLPGVRGVGYSDSVPGDGYGTSTVTYRSSAEGRIENNINMAAPGPGFFEVYGVEPLAGRLFSEDYGSDRWIDPDLGPSEEMPSVIINESAARAMGFASPAEAIGQVAENVTFALNQDMQIVGVVPDLRWSSVREPVTAMIYFGRRDFTFSLSIKTEAGAQESVIAAIEDLWAQTLPGVPVVFQVVSDNIATQYDEEKRASFLFVGLTLLALVVSSLGLYGLAAFAAQRRTREIALRKVMGARIFDILRLLLIQFSIPVLVANLLAWPVAGYFMSEWLKGFAYRIELSPLPFILAGLAALFVAWATTAGHAWRVARSSPITSLRQE